MAQADSSRARTAGQQFSITTSEPSQGFRSVFAQCRLALFTSAIAFH
jgi:hypothetical protein